MADETVLRARLAEAEDALHRISIGGQIVEIEYEGHRQKFGKTDEAKLRQYIRSLKIALGEGVSSRSRRVVFK